MVKKVETTTVFTTYEACDGKRFIFEKDAIAYEERLGSPTEHCTCPPRKWYNPIAQGICTICGKER